MLGKALYNLKNINELTLGLKLNFNVKFYSFNYINDNGMIILSEGISSLKDLTIFDLGLK